MSLWSRAKSVFQRPSDATTHVVHVSSDGFKVCARGSASPEASMRWDEVICVRTYKLDLFTVDCICLLFERAGAAPVQVSEEWEGFVELMERMRERFPSIPSDWYMKVMQPAFERNETVLYERFASA
jgi:hypothetical protein